MNFTNKDWIMIFISFVCIGVVMFQPINPLIGFLFIGIGLLGIIIISVMSFYKTHSKGNKNKKPTSGYINPVLKYASHPEQFRIISQDGKEIFGSYDENFIWKEIAIGICKALDLKHIEYYNLGSEYELINLANNKSIEIPTDIRLKDKITKHGIKNGQLLVVKEK